jgi:hypothetical protein
MTLGFESAVAAATPVNVVLIVTFCCLFIGAMMVDCFNDDDDMDGLA